MEFMIEQEEVTLFCQKAGNGPLLLLIHGVACDSDYFKETVTHLEKHFTVLTYDRRGYSRSVLRGDGGERKEKFSAEKQAEDAAAVIRQQNIGKAFVVGCSAGGIIALLLASKYPELVTALILQEPPLAGTKELQKQLDDWSLELSVAASKQQRNKALLLFVKVMGGFDKRTKSKSLELQLRDMENMVNFTDNEREDFLKYRISSVDAVCDYSKSAKKVLPQISLPCMMIVGEESREGLFSRAAKSTANKMGWPLIQAPGFHNLPTDLPYEFAMLVLASANP